MALASGLGVTVNAQMQNTQLGKLYVKWLPGDYEKVSKCFRARDQVLDSKDAPILRSDKSGLYYFFSVDIERLDPKCGAITLVPGQDLDGLELSVDDNQSDRNVLTLKFKGRLPFEHILFQDEAGSKLELLLESKLEKSQDLSFLRFFSRSRFMGRMFALSRPSFQAPIAILDYELPTFFEGRLLMQAQVGQSLWSFSDTPLYFGFYDLAVAWRWFGRGNPLDEPFNLKTRLVYEGVQINDSLGTNLYEILGTRMFGAGVESSIRLSSNWALWNRSDYLLTPTALYSISKIKSEGSISYRLSRRWRAEVGSRYSKVSRADKLTSFSNSVSELGFFVGMRLNPENLLGR